MIAPLKVRNEINGNEEQVYALLDSASDQSFISSALSERLQLTPHSETSIIVNTFGGHAEKKHVKRVEALLLNQKEQSLKVTLLTNHTITQTIPISELNMEDKLFLEDKFPNFENYWLLDPAAEIIPEILLGIDYFNLILQVNEPVLQLPSGLHMTPTFFGPVISGKPSHPVQPSSSNSINMYNSQCTQEHSNLDYSDLWKLPGVGTDELHTNEELNQQIIANFYSTVQIKE
ncbi:hypothetical protein TELCIR_17424, partial [Teladorsagia circumcincta]